MNFLHKLSLSSFLLSQLLPNVVCASELTIPVKDSLLVIVLKPHTMGGNLGKSAASAEPAHSIKPTNHSYNSPAYPLHSSNYRAADFN